MTNAATELGLIKSGTANSNGVEIIIKVDGDFISVSQYRYGQPNADHGIHNFKNIEKLKRFLKVNFGFDAESFVYLK